MRGCSGCTSSWRVRERSARSRQSREWTESRDNLADRRRQFRQLPHRRGMAGWHEVGHEVGHRQQHKGTLGKAQVWNLEILGLDLPIAVQNDVEIDRPRAPADSACATQVTL